MSFDPVQLLSIGRQSFEVWQDTSRFSKRMTETEKAMAVGWLTGWVGLLIHILSCVSLTVAKIAIPFWFLTGVVFTALKAKQKPSP